ncbi:MAG: YfhO family protein [Thermoleophilaceae bacterium]|nr:YfhO family protein [Thermoleophilaceae bacterium]
MTTRPAAARRMAARDHGLRLTRWARAHPAAVAAVLYAALSVVFVGQGLVPGRTLSSSDGLWTMTPWSSSRPPEVKPLGANFELADAVAVFQPFFEYTRSALADIPLWNPHIMGGRPFLANAQSAIFSPFSLPAYALPLSKALAVMAALKLFVAAFGTYLLGRALRMRFGGALLAGVVFAFGTFFVVWLAWPLTNIFPLIPWLLLLTELVIRRPDPLPVAGLAGLVALQFFGGHPETSFHVMFATVAYFAFRVLLDWRRGGRRQAALIPRTVAFAAALALGTAVAALTLLPLLELLAASADYERRLDSAPSFAPSRFLGALFLNDYWGRPTQTPIAAFVSNRGYYAGGITLMLAAAALIGRPTITRIAVASFGLFCLALALGFEPLARTVVELPGFRTAHNGRLVIFLLFALALLAGWGLDDLSRRNLPARVRRRLALAAAVIFCVPIGWMLVAGTIDLGRVRPALEVAWGFGDPPSATSPIEAAGVAPIVRMNALLQWLPLAGAALALIAIRVGVVSSARRRLPVAAFVALATAVLVVDLFRANMGFNPAIPIEHAEQPTTGAIRYLQSRSPNRFVGLGKPGAIQPLGPDVAMRYGLHDARGYDYPVERRFDRLWREAVGPRGDVIPPTTVALPTARALRTLSLLSVADVVQDPARPPLRLPGLRLAYSGPDARVYRNTRALPRVFLVDRQRPVDGEEAALAAVSGSGVDTRRVAVVEGRLPGLPEDRGAPVSTGDPGPARLIAYERERVVARAITRRPALLVLTDVHYPGWNAWVDGRSVPLERVDYLLRGLLLSPGSHTVELRYQPATWRVGWIVSLLGVVGLACLALAGLRGHRALGRASR